MDEGKTNRRMVSHHFKAYTVKFNDVYDFPVYVSMVYGDRRKLKPEVQKKVDMIEELLRTKGKGTFKVQKDFSIVLESLSE